VPLSSGDGNSPIMKKVKVEEKSESLWDSYVSTRMVLHAWAWVIMQMIIMYTIISVAHTFLENNTLNFRHCQDYCDKDQHVFFSKSVPNTGEGDRL
jgi:hypothetical protein